VLAKEEIKKMESQVKSLTDRAAELERKLEESGESNRIITQVKRETRKRN
jgi:predicted nuclease with TOPRIM domain